MFVKGEKPLSGFERRTPEWLRQEAEKKGLRVGKKVEIEKISSCEGVVRKRITKSGKVTGLYPYIFVCECSGTVECFRYNQFVGNENGEKVRLNG